MKKKTVKYTDDKGEMDGDWVRIKEAFPSLRELADIAPQTKVTLALDDMSLEFFKREARRHKTSYQRMIRNLLRSYARAHSG